jgi:hypothetical protein
VPASGMLWCSSWRLAFSREFQQLLNKVAIRVHTGYFPNVRAYSPINCGFVGHMGSTFQLKKNDTQFNSWASDSDACADNHGMESKVGFIHV